MSSFHFQLLGLCGNYNGDDNDELQVSSGGPQVHSVQTFVKDWQLHKHCKLPAARDLQCRNESKKLEAQSQCAVLKGPLFEDCHNDVDVEPYLERLLILLNLSGLEIKRRCVRS